MWPLWRRRSLRIYPATYAYGGNFTSISEGQLDLDRGMMGGLTATTWATALIRPIAPKTKPTSAPLPIAINVPAPKLCNAGFPPLVNEFNDVKRMKSGCDEVGVMETSRLAVASVKKEIEVTMRSKARERARKVACETSGSREGAK